MAVVSVNIPTYQRDEMLRRAIRSALDQTVTDLEVNVSDNDNSPKVRELVESFNDPRLTYLPLEENIGIHGNLTRCLHLGSSPYVIVLHDDDVLYPECLEHLLHVLEEAPAAGVAHCAMDYIDANGRVTVPQVNWADASADRYETGSEFIERTLLGGVRINMSSALMRRDAISAERLDRRDGVYADLALWLRVAQSWDVAYVHRPLAGAAIHVDTDSARDGWQRVDEEGNPTVTADGVSPHRPLEPEAQRAQVRLVRSNKVRFVRERVSGRRARRAAMKRVRRYARRELKEIVADTIEHQSSWATLRDLAESARIEPSLLLTPWPMLLAAARVVGRGPYDALVARRTPR